MRRAERERVNGTHPRRGRPRRAEITGRRGRRRGAGTRHGWRRSSRHRRAFGPFGAAWTTHAVWVEAVETRAFAIGSEVIGPATRREESVRCRSPRRRTEHRWSGDANAWCRCRSRRARLGRSRRRTGPSGRARRDGRDAVRSPSGAAWQRVAQRADLRMAYGSRSGKPRRATGGSHPKRWDSATDSPSDQGLEGERLPTQGGQRQGGTPTR